MGFIRGSYCVRENQGRLEDASWTPTLLVSGRFCGAVVAHYVFRSKCAWVIGWEQPGEAVQTRG